MARAAFESSTWAAPGWFSVSLSRLLLWIQGGYYLVTGLWPLLSIRTFVAVTGPKTDNLPTGLLEDHWLVMTAGVLITAIGASLLVAAWQGRSSPEAVTLAIGAAVGLTAIDVIYVIRGVIGPIYLADAAVEIVLIVGWIVALTRHGIPQTPNTWGATA